MPDNMIYSPLVQDYIDMMSEVSEAPTEYHIVVLTHTISALLGRNFYIQQGTDRIFPNLYTLIVAPSSEYKKSSASKRFYSFLSDVNDTKKYLGRIGSPEGLLNRLSNSDYHGTAHLYYSEFGEFLAGSRKKFNADIIEIMMDLYDCPPNYKKPLKKESYEVDKPCLTLLGATQLTSLTRYIEQEDLTSGLLPRFFVCYTENLRDPIIWRPDVNDALKKKVTYGLLEIKNHIELLVEQANSPDRINLTNINDLILPKRIEVTERAKDFFIKWGEKKRKIRGTLPALISTMYGRIESLVLKLATIILFANMRPDEEPSYIVNKDIMKKAMYLSKFHEDSYNKLVGSDLQFTQHGKQLNIVREQIKKNGSVGIGDIMRYCNVKKWDAEIIADDLLELEDIEEFEGPRGGRKFRRKVENLTTPTD